MSEDSVVVVRDKEHLYQAMAIRNKALGGSCFAERYIQGREFNFSLLTSPKGPVLLPPAEILFDRYPPEKRKIVGYRAKWDTDSLNTITLLAVSIPLGRWASAETHGGTIREVLGSVRYPRICTG